MNTHDSLPITDHIVYTDSVGDKHIFTVKEAHRNGLSLKHYAEQRIEKIERDIDDDRFGDPPSELGRDAADNPFHPDLYEDDYTDSLIEALRNLNK